MFYTEANLHTGARRVMNREALETRIRAIGGIEFVDYLIRRLDGGYIYEGEHAWFRRAQKRDVKKRKAA